MENVEKGNSSFLNNVKNVVSSFVLVSALTSTMLVISIIVISFLPKNNALTELKYTPDNVSMEQKTNITPKTNL